MKTLIDSSCAAVEFMCEMLGVDDRLHSSALVCYADVPVAGVLFTRKVADSAIIGIWVEEARKTPREWGHSVFNYAFNVLGLDSLISYAAEDNAKSIAMTERVGFHQIDSSPDGSVRVYCMRREDCWMLKSKKWGRHLEVN